MIKTVKNLMFSMAILGATISTGFAAKEPPRLYPTQLSFIEKMEAAQKLMPVKFHTLFDSIIIDMPSNIYDVIFDTESDLIYDPMYVEIFYPLMALDTNPIKFIAGNFKNTLDNVSEVYYKYNSPIDMLHQKLIMLKSSLTLILEDAMDKLSNKSELKKDLLERLEKLEKIIFFVGKINDFKKEALFNNPIESSLQILKLAAVEYNNQYPHK